MTIAPTETGFEFGAILTDSSSPSTYEFVLDTGGLDAVVDQDGLSILLIDPNATPAYGQTGPVVVGRIDPPGATDAGGLGTTNLDVHTGLVHPGDATYPAGVTADMVNGLGKNEVLLVYSIDPAWLANPLRSYPITLDPNVCVQQSGGNGCVSGYTETYIMSALPDTYLTSHSFSRVGLDYRGTGFGEMYELMYFPSVDLAPTQGSGDDGAQIISANLSIHQTYNEGSGTMGYIARRAIHTWDTHATWNKMSAYSTSSEQVTTYSCGGHGSDNCIVNMDVSNLVRHWYTTHSADWVANLGFMLLPLDSSKPELDFDLGSVSNAANRPTLTINYVVPHVSLDFAPELGPNYAPSAMPAGQTTTLPVIVHNYSSSNSGSGFTFNSTNDTSGWRYALGYRFFDAKGNLAGSSTTPLALPADIPDTQSSDPLALPVTAPTTPGSYTLRLDLVHIKGSDCTSTGNKCLWTSDWADPALYGARDKRNYDPANTRWVGNSVIEREEFPIAVHSGGGTATGPVKSITLGDGSVVGVNLWSATLHYTGSGGVGFSDVLPTDLSYQYDSANVTTCTQTLTACGWSTNVDERLTAGTNPGDYTYQDPQGNTYFLNTDPSGQITGGPGSIERVRYTLLDEVRRSWDSRPAFDTNNPYTGVISYQINSGATATANGVGTIPLNNYAQLNMAIRAEYSTTRGGIALEVWDATTGGVTWMGYTLGPSWTMSGVGWQTSLSGSMPVHWQAFSRDMYGDVKNNLSIFNASGKTAVADDTFYVLNISLVGNTSGHTINFDSVYLAPGSSTEIADALPSFSSGGSNASLNTSDFEAGTASVQVSAIAEASSPTVSGLSKPMTTYPFIKWSWRKVNGSSIAVAYTIKDVRTGISGTIVYYAGAYQADYGDATKTIQVSTTLPGAWTTLLRNVAADAHQLLGFYNDPKTSSPSSAPSTGSTPDDLLLTGYTLIAGEGQSQVQQGEYGLFDEMYELTQSGVDPVVTPGPQDIVITSSDGSQHFFNTDGLLERVVDRNGNTISLSYNYDYTKQGQAAYTLTTIHAPGDGMALSSGTAQREIVVTHPDTTHTLFTEQLGSTTSYTGRFTEFVTNSSNDLVTVIPARRSAACATSGSTGCLTFTYAGSHLLSKVYDPRSNGSDTNYTSIANSGTAPTSVTDASSGQAMLVVDSYAAATSPYKRVLWQDQAALAANKALYVDLSPDGSPLNEYAPKSCMANPCVPGTSNSYPTTPTSADLTATYAFDGIGQYSSEIRYECHAGTAPCGATDRATVSRRGTYAALAVDNLNDPLTASETPWSQSPDQYYAWAAAGKPCDGQEYKCTDPALTEFNKYRTTYTYNALHEVVDTTTPYAGPAGSVVPNTMRNVYDAAGNLTSTSDDTFLVNAGFEYGSSGANAGWTFNAPAAITTSASHSGTSSLSLPAGSGSATQNAQLLPGQEFRFQIWAVSASGGHVTYKIDYQNTAQAWTALVPATALTPASWTQYAQESRVPVDGNGLIRITLSDDATSGTGYADDIDLFTTYGATAYSDGSAGVPKGLPTHTYVVNEASNPVQALVDTRLAYQATASTPAIFATAKTANYVDGTYDPAHPDQDLTSTTVYDAWGRTVSATDPDGVANTTTYATNLTDVASSADGLGDATSFGYDIDGNKTSVTTPLNETTTTVYDLEGHATQVTGPTGIVTKNYYSYGLMTSSIANWIDGTPSGPTGIDDVTTTYTYDGWGNQTSVVTDAGTGLIDAKTTSTYDSLGNVVSTTTYADSGYTQARTTTAYFDDYHPSSGSYDITRPKLTGSAGPIVPTSGRLCPGSSSDYCNSAAVLDLGGRTAMTYDAYGIPTQHLFDLDGHEVRTVVNYVDGTFDPAHPDTDVTTDNRYDLDGGVVGVTDVLGRITSTVRDALDRATKVIKPDLSWVRTDYTPGGRTAATSRPGNQNQGDGDVVWTHNVYDAAGRQTATIANWDRSGAAQLQITTFESGTAEGVTGAANWAVSSASSLSANLGTTTSGTANSGFGALTVTPSASSASGASLALTGTFKAGHTYQATVYARATTAGQSWRLTLGASGDSYTASSGTALSTTAFTPLTVSWQAASDHSSGVLVAVTDTADSGNAVAVIDDIAVWDTGSPDRNVYSLSVFDTDGHPVASILPGGSAGDSPMVTRTAYDTLGRVTDVTVAAVAGAGETLTDTNLRTHSDYDNLGRTTATTNPAGVTTHYVFNRIGKVVSATENYQDGVWSSANPDQDVTSTFAYDAAGEMTGYCSAQNRGDAGTSCDPTSSVDQAAWHYGYDAGGNLVFQTPPVATNTPAGSSPLGATAWIYDAGGHMTRICNMPGNGASCTVATRYTDTGYDAAGRVVTTRVFTGAPGSGTLKLSTTYAYAGDGFRLSTSFDGTASGEGTDLISFVPDGLNRVAEVRDRSGNLMTEFTYNADATVATRTDPSGITTFGYDWNGRLTTTSEPALSTVTPMLSYRLDGLVATRTWSGTGATGTFSYDRAKRPIGLSIGGAAATLALAQTYDRAGNATSESRNFGQISSVPAGQGTQSFSYDGLNRIVSDSVGSTTLTYTYDRDSNRTSVSNNGVVTSYAYDRTDQLVSETKAGTPTYATFDAYGNLTGDPETGAAGVTTYTYDAGDRLTAITPPAPLAGATNFGLDALGRTRTRTVAGSPTSTDTYSFVGSSETVCRIVTVAGTSTTTLDALLGSEGTRFASVASGATNATGLLIPDLHGDVAAAVSSSFGSTTDALRYDGYGEVVASVTSALPTPWRYQGRLLVSPSGGADLYDAGARFYSPGLGLFTQLDSVAGSAQNPISMNRYLYAGANPWTLIDPDGHWPWDDAAKAVSSAVNTATNAASSAVNTAANVAHTAVNVASHIDPSTAAHLALGAASMVPVVGSAAAVADASLYVAEGDYMDAAMSMTAVIPGGAIIAQGSRALKALKDVDEAVTVVNDVEKADKALTAIDEVETVANDAGRAEKAATEAEDAEQASKKLQYLEDAGDSCAHSFSPDTQVATATGPVPIAGLKVGQTVLAYDPRTGETSAHTIDAVMVHTDPVVEHLDLSTGSLETTPNHPFFTTDRAWVEAGDLLVGEHVRTDTGSDAVVLSFTLDATPSSMWDLTVDSAHSFFVGSGAVLVHNQCGPGGPIDTRQAADRANQIDHSTDLETLQVGGRVIKNVPLKAVIGATVLTSFVGFAAMGGDYEDGWNAASGTRRPSPRPTPSPTPTATWYPWTLYHPAASPSMVWWRWQHR